MGPWCDAAHVLIQYMVTLVPAVTLAVEAAGVALKWQAMASVERFCAHTGPKSELSVAQPTTVGGMPESRISGWYPW